MHAKVQIAFTLAAFAASVSGVTAAHAEDEAQRPGATRQAVESAIAVEEARTVDLQRLAELSRTQASDLEAQARSRDASAADFYARSKEFSSLAARLSGPSRATVNGFATAMNVYAQSDQKMASASRQAADIVKQQTKDAEAGIAAHQKHVTQLRQSLEEWK